MDFWFHTVTAQTETHFECHWGMHTHPPRAEVWPLLLMLRLQGGQPPCPTAPAHLLVTSPRYNTSDQKADGCGNVGELRMKPAHGRWRGWGRAAWHSCLPSARHSWETETRHGAEERKGGKDDGSQAFWNDHEECRTHILKLLVLLKEHHQCTPEWFPLQ